MFLLEDTGKVNFSQYQSVETLLFAQNVSIRALPVIICMFSDVSVEGFVPRTLHIVVLFSVYTAAPVGVSPFA